MINSFSQTIIYGQLEFVMGTGTQPHDCTANYQETVDCTKAYQAPGVFQYKNPYGCLQIPISDMHRAAAEKLKDRYITRCVTRQIEGSLNRMPQALKHIYERNEKIWTENELDNCTWHPRIKMFWKAHQCNEIFALSVVPKDPSVAQTWYAKKLVTYDDKYDLGGSGSGISICTDIKDSDTLINTKPDDFKAGFIKPFKTYNCQSQATIDLDNLPQGLQIDLLTDSDHVDEMVEQDYSESMQEVVKSVLNSFLEDSEATHVGLLTINPHQQKIYMKV